MTLYSKLTNILTTTNTTPTTSTTPTTTTNSSPVKRKVIFVCKTTQNGQSMFIRGGIDDKVFRPLCMNAETSECSISIQVNSLGTGTPWTSYDAWRNGDTNLDWFGTQAGQGTYLGSSAFGTPLAWTKSNSTLPEYQKLTKWGDHHHMVDFDMDCSETEGGWFDVKAYINNFASGWETDIVPSSCTGSGTTGPSSLSGTKNHLNRCGT